MWAVLGFVLVAAIGLVVVLAAGRGSLAQNNTYPWKLYATASTHVGIMGGLAGFAFTGVVLRRDSRVRPARHRREFARYSHRDVLGGLSLVGRQRLSDFLHSARRDKRRVSAAGPFQPCLNYRISHGLSILVCSVAAPRGEWTWTARLRALLSSARISAFRVRAHCNVRRWPGFSCGYGKRIFQRR